LSAFCEEYKGDSEDAPVQTPSKHSNTFKAICTCMCTLV
jgi:hypothetical protein